MIAALSCVSSRGVWILTDDQASRILAQECWEDSQSTGLSAQIAQRYKKLVEHDSSAESKLCSLFGVQGPGAFTGLRMSSAFLQGLAAGLSQRYQREIPLFGIPTYSLRDRTFFIPLRHQKARALDREEAPSQGIEFLRISGARDFQVMSPEPTSEILGLKDLPLWPSPEDLLSAVHSQLKSPQPLELMYGLEPKISGQRGP